MSKGSMISEQTKKKLAKSAISGAVLATSATLLYGTDSIPMFGFDLPAAVPFFIAGAGSSIATDYLHEMYPSLGPGPLGMKAGDLAASASSAAISGAASVLILSATAGLPMANAGKAFMLGAGSELAGEFIYQKLLLDQKGRLVF